MKTTPTTYSAEIPDTLDLAERARLAVSGLVRVIDPSRGHQPFQCWNPYRNPPVFSHEPGGYVFEAGNEMWGKHGEALLEMRLASGSDEGRDLQEKALAGMAACITDDGMFTSRPMKVKGDDLVPQETFSTLVGGARVMLAFIGAYQATGNEEWKRQAGRLAKGFIDVAIRNDGKAYYPDGHVGGGIGRPSSGWTDTREPLGNWLSEARDFWDCASDTTFTHGGIVQALCAWYRLTGEKASLELAAGIAKFMMQDKYWRPEGKPEAVVAAEHAHYEGHIHATVRGLWGLLEYAVIAGDERIKDFVRDGYEYTRQFGIARIGLFGEGCTIGDMTGLAVRMSETGVADCWEDVDQYVRNHLTELQILDPGVIAGLSASAPATRVKKWEASDRFPERITGLLCDGALHPTVATPGLMMCCSYNGLVGMYHAWDAIVRGRGDVAEVNLLLNRASPWVDVESSLPYEGRVVLRNKTAPRVAVRIPRWADLSAVKASVNGKTASPFWIGRRAVIDSTKPGDVVELTFPVTESEAHYTVGWSGIHVPGWTEVTRLLDLPKPPQPLEYQVSAARRREPAPQRPEFTIRFRGNDVVDIAPREGGPGQPLYKRSHVKAGAAPMRRVTRTVTGTTLDI